MISEASRRLGTRPPWITRAWQPRDDQLCRRLPVGDFWRMGETLTEVGCRRHMLVIHDRRTQDDR
jgi:hypothetical protein